MRSSILLPLAGLSAISVSASSEIPARPADRVAAQEIRTIGDLRTLLRDAGALPADERRRLLAALRYDPRIVGGFPVAITNHPWQVALVRGLAADRLQFCGGSLIAPDLVLTAAHCIDGTIVLNDPRRVDVVAGTGNYSAGGTRVDVRAVHVHPQWNSTSNDYDVAILHLRTPVAGIRPIALEPQTAPVGARAMVTGWGAMGEGGAGTFDLLGVDVPIVDTATCNEPQSYGGSITGRMLCAGERDGGKDSCQGDSGGPLSLGSGSSARLVGIVSWGEGCARRLKYGVYTRISAVAPWIQSFMASRNHD